MKENYDRVWTRGGVCFIRNINEKGIPWEEEKSSGGEEKPDPPPPPPRPGGTGDKGRKTLAERAYRVQIVSGGVSLLGEKKADA